MSEGPVIWHNPRCTKSRQTLALLEEKGLQPQVRLYLKDPPSVEELTGAQNALGLSVLEMMRKGEKQFKELGLADASDDQLIAAMAENPILIERPVVFWNGRAVIGRPPEAVLDLL